MLSEMSTRYIYEGIPAFDVTSEILSFCRYYAMFSTDDSDEDAQICTHFYFYDAVPFYQYSRHHPAGNVIYSYDLLLSGEQC